MKGMLKIRLVIALLATAVVINVFSIVFIHLTAQVQYMRLFGTKVTMAYDQATFEGAKEQVLSLWSQMNTTFSGYELENTYSSPWFWEQYYENSLKAEQDYFKQLILRLDQTITEKNQILSGNKTILVPYNQWYQQSLDGLRAEMQREGGLDWAIWGAWYLNYAPMAYWLSWWLPPFDITIAIAILLLYMIEED